jgi:hypothetical protein
MLEPTHAASHTLPLSTESKTMFLLAQRSSPRWRVFKKWSREFWWRSLESTCAQKCFRDWSFSLKKISIHGSQQSTTSTRPSWQDPRYSKDTGYSTILTETRGIFPYSYLKVLSNRDLHPFFQPVKFERTISAGNASLIPQNICRGDLYADKTI